MIIDSRVDTASGPVAALEPKVHRRWIQAVTNGVHQAQQMGISPVILCSEAARTVVRKSIQRELPEVPVLAVPEITADIATEGIGEIGLDEE
jgi:flagellar biosynthesis protein FlhA